MTSHLSTIICVIFGVVSLYYFNKYLDKQRKYDKLHEQFTGIHLENQKMKSRIKDLQSYRDDVSKTFKILDNELMMINEHLKNQESNHSIQATVQTSQNIPNTFTSTIPIGRIPLTRVTSFTNLNPGNNVSLLTPELLTSLFNMNSEDIQRQNTRQNTRQNIPPNTTQNTPQNTPPNTPSNTPQNIQPNTQNLQYNLQYNQDKESNLEEKTQVNLKEDLENDNKDVLNKSTIEMENISSNVVIDENSVYDDNRYSMISNYSEDMKSDSYSGLEFNVNRNSDNILYDISSQKVNENSYDKYLLNNN